MKNKNNQQRAFQTFLKLRRGRATTLLTLGCFSLPLSSAHAHGMPVLPPVVVHPSHQLSASPVNSGQSGASSTAGSHGFNGANGSNKSAASHGGTTTSNNVTAKQTGLQLSAGKNFSSGQNVAGQNTTTQTPSSSPASLPSAGYKLDLSSTTANIVLGSNLFTHSQSINIDVGGSNQKFSAGQKVTAAEYVAIQQQLSGNGQTLVLSAQGAADAGKFSLSPTLSAAAFELIVPKGVTALEYLSKSSSLDLAGELINSGSIYAISTNPAITSASISAREIINESSGIISTALPPSLASIHGANQNLSLSLAALNNITNAGIISSSGALSLATTSGAINNNSGAVISAAGNVNLNTGNGNVANNGLASSANGNLNVTAPGSQDINIQGAGGTFQALHGNINVRDSSYNGNNNLSLSGGNYLSQNLNLYSGNGQINTNVGQVTGNLNSSAQVEHFAAASQNLILGNNTITGDPTYANTGGNIVISGSNTFSENVAILAAGNITSNTAGQIIDAGNNVTLVAGVDINLGGSGTGGNNATSVTVGAGGTATSLTGTQTATVDFSTGGGGNIDFTASTATTVIDTHGTSAGESGGSVTLAALNTFFGGGGQVLFSTTNTSIDTHGNGTGNGGNISIYAGANPLAAATVIQTGAIVAGGGANGGSAGNITMFTSQPTSTSGTTVRFDTHGNVTAGGITESSISPNGQIVTGQISSFGAGGYGATAAAAGGIGGKGGTIIIHAGDNVTTSDILAFGGGGGGAGGNSVFGGGNGGNGGLVVVSSDNGVVTINGEVNTSGGGGGGYFLSPTTGGAGGGVLIAGGGVGTTIKNGIYAANGGAGGAGLSGSGGGGSYGGGGGGAGGAFAGGGGGGGAGYLGGGGGGGGDINNVGGGGQGGGFLSGAGGAGGGTGQTGGSNFLSNGGTGGADGGFFAGGAGGTGITGGSPGQSSNGGQPGASAPIVAGPGAKISISQGVISASGNAPLVLNVSQGQSTNGGFALYSSTSQTALQIDTTAGALQIVANGGSAGSLTGNGGQAAIINTGMIIVNPAALAVAPLGLSGNGGLIELEGNTISSSNGNALVLNASGVGSGSGGAVEVSNQSNATQTIGTAPGNFELIANSGPSGNLGGTVQFGSGGNIVVNSAQLSVAVIGPVGSGGQIALAAGFNGGAGTLVINGSLDVSGKGAGQSGGMISLNSNSPVPFTVGQSSGNGISGTITTTAGVNSEISINNKGGGLETFVPISASGIVIDAAGNIVIGAPIIGLSSPFSSDVGVVATGSISYINPNSPQPIVGSFVSIGGPAGLGTALAPLALNAAHLTIESGGATHILNYAEGGQALLVSNILTGPLSYTGTGNISVNEQAASFSATAIAITSGILAAGDTAGNITFGGSAIATGNVNITTSGANTIIEQNSAVIQGSNVTLQTGSGGIGTSGNTFLVSAPQLSVLTSGLVNIYDQNASGVTLLSAPTQNSFALTSAGLLTVGANTLNAATSITLASSNNGNININGTVGGAATVGGVNLFAVGSGNITGTGTIIGGPMVLSSTTGGVFLNVNTLDLTVTAGQVNIADATTLGGFVLRNSSGSNFTLSYGGPGPWTTNTLQATGSVLLQGSGNLSLGAISSAGNIIVGDGLHGGNGSILITGELSSALSGTIGLYANGSGSITQNSPNATINSHLGTVNLASNTGSLGTATSLLNLVADNLSAVTTGLVNIGDSSGTTLTLTNANSTNGFFLYSQGTIIVNTAGLNSASAIGLFAQANDGGITLNNPIGNANTQVSLLANGAGLISQTGNTYVAGSSVNLAAGQGGIYLNINTNNITANGGGIVSLGDLSFSTATLNNSTAGTSFSLGSNGSLILNNILASAGYVNILSDGALLQTAPGAGISANGGALILENANTASGAINIGAGDYIHTFGSGNQFPVYIIIGAVPPTPVQGSKPATVTVNNVSGGTAYFGSNGISAPTAPVTLNLAGSNIVFNTGARAASAITVNSGVTITADPVNAGSGVVLMPTSIETLNQVFAQTVGAAPSVVSRDWSVGSGPSLLAPATLEVGRMQNSWQNGTQNAATEVGQNGTQINVLHDVIGNTNSAIAGAACSSVINATSAIATMRPGGEYWMSDTELSNGRIPAILFSDEELGIKTDVSTIVELEEENTAVTNEDLDTRNVGGGPLIGSVTRSIQGTRVMNLKRGSVVFAPTQATLVHTSFGDVHMDARSIVLMMAFRHGLAIYNLHDGHGKAVALKAGDQNLILGPGMQAVITSESVRKFEEVNPAAFFGYRNLKTRALGQGLRAFISEFSIPQAVTTVAPLRQLVTSKYPDARRCANQLLKTAALIGQTRGGAYEQIARMESAAYLK